MNGEPKEPDSVATDNHGEHLSLPGSLDGSLSRLGTVICLAAALAAGAIAAVVFFREAGE